MLCNAMRDKFFRLERYMVVGDWRGVRTDWPHDAGAEKTDMLWQWTFTNVSNENATTTTAGTTTMMKRKAIIIRISKNDKYVNEQ